MNKLNSLISLLDLKGLTKGRNEAIKNADPKISEEDNSSKIAKYLHPKSLKLKVIGIIDETYNVKTFVLQGVDKLTPYFKAGQYIDIYLEIDGKKYTRPYSLSSSPNMALKNVYNITVKKVNNGIVTSYLFNELKEGDVIEASSPQGFLTYSSIRDEKNVIGIAGGSGITPFYSMAQAILEGSEDFNLIIFYGIKKDEDIIFHEQFDDIVCKTNRIKVIYVLSEEKNTQYENGFITVDLIKKYITTQASIFISGPSKMCEYLDKELAKFNYPKKFYRSEQVYLPKGLSTKKYQLKIISGDNEQITTIIENETILKAIEKSGLFLPSSCQNGTCGFCRSKLVKGKVYSTKDSRRLADKKYNYIHPCCTYAKSDLVIKID